MPLACRRLIISITLSIDRNVYVVLDNDTIRSIAVKHDVTAAELARANGISAFSPVVYPGMRLKLPPASASKASPPPAPYQQPQVAKTSSSSAAKPVSRGPVAFAEEEDQLDPDKYIRVNAKRVTESTGSPWGSILVSPSNFVFVPNQTDPTVVEMQREEDEPQFFAVMAPLELVANFAIFTDLAVQQDKDFGVLDGSNEKRQALYEPKLDNIQATINDYKRERDSNPVEDKEKKKPAEWELHDDDNDLPEPVCLRVWMCKPLGKKLPRNTPMISDGVETLLPYYTFMLKRARARPLYAFLASFQPLEGKYGLLDHAKVERRGMEVIREGQAIVEKEAGRETNRASIKALQENAQAMLSSLDIYADQWGHSDVFLEDTNDRQMLTVLLPAATAAVNDLVRVFSTAEDGCSLSNLYRRCPNIDYDGPVLILVEDCKGHAFGTFLSSPPRETEKAFTGKKDHL